MPDFRLRAGRFLVVLGVVLLALFVFSDVGSQPRYDLFFYSAAALTVGILLVRSNPPQKVASGRFRLLKRKPKEPKKK